ncbi:hypothetical protein OQA88_8647 [Cercophora sp. LCS_1]
MRGEPVSPVSTDPVNGEGERGPRDDLVQPGIRASTPTPAEDSPFVVGHLRSSTESPRDWSRGPEPPRTDRAPGSDGPHPSTRKPWSPIFLRRTVLSMLVAFLVVLMIAIAALFGVSNKNGGLSSADERLYYLWVYGPTAVLTLIAAIWAPVEYRGKQITPWIILSRGFRPATDNVLLDYVDGINFVDLFKSFRKRHWLAFSVIGASFLIQLATVVSSGLFVSSHLLLHDDNTPLVARDAFGVSGRFTAGSKPATNVFGALTSNLSFPAGTDGGYAFQRFDAGRGELRETVDFLFFTLTFLDSTFSLTAEVDVFRGSLSCERASIVEVSVKNKPVATNNTLPVDPTSGSGQVASFDERTEADITLETASCSNLVINVNRPSEFKYNGSACDEPGQETDASNRFVVVWGRWLNSTSDIPVKSRQFTLASYNFEPSLALVCTPTYTIRKGSVQLDRDSSGSFIPSVLTATNGATSTLRDISAWDLLVEFVRTIVETRRSLILGMDGFVNIILDKANKSTSDAHAQQEALSDLFGLVTAQLANEYLKTPQNAPLTGKTVSRETRLVVSSVSFWLMESLLLLLTLAATYIIFNSPRLPISADPSTIRGLASALSASKAAVTRLEGTGRMSNDALQHHLKNDQFKTEVADHDFRLELQSAAETRRLLEKDEVRKITKDNKAGYRPFTVTITGRLLILLSFPALILTLELLYQHSTRNNGLGEVDNSDKFSHYAWTYIPTAVMVGLGLLVTMLSFTVKLLSPYHSLKKGNATAAQSTDENYMRTMAIVSTWHAILNKKWGVVTASLAAMLSPFLTIVASGLLTASSTTSFTHSFSIVNAFNLSQADRTSGLQLANLVLANNLSDPIWTYNNLALPHLSSPSPLQSLSGTTTSATLTIPAIRAHANCTEPTPAQLKCEYIPLLNDTYTPYSTTFSGTGSFGISTDLPYFTNPEQCPPLFLALGRVTDEIIDSVSHAACYPYAEVVSFSGAFTLPSWELNTSLPIAAEPTGAVAEVGLTGFMEAFADLTFANPAGELSTARREDLGGVWPLVVYGRDGTPVSELMERGWRDEVDDVFGVVMAQFMNQARVEAQGDSVEGTVTVSGGERYRVVMSGVGTRVLEGLLGVMDEEAVT